MEPEDTEESGRSLVTCRSAAMENPWVTPWKKLKEKFLKAEKKCEGSFEKFQKYWQNIYDDHH